MLRDLVYTTLGAGIIAKERLTQELEELKTHGEESRQKAQELQKKLETKAKQEEQRLKSEIKEIVKEIIEEMDLATKQDLKDIKK